MGEVEDRTRLVEEAMVELAKFYHKLKAKQIDLDGRIRRENILIYGVQAQKKDHNLCLNLWKLC